MSNKSNSEIITRVIETSNNDINIWDVLSEFDSEQEGEILDFIDENIEEFEIFLNTALIHIVERLKLRIAFATAEEEKANTLTTDQLQELLQIQKDFDDRIPTLNLGDSKIAYVVEFFEWFNTLETFKNWKKKPGKPLDVQLDELADMLAFGLSIANQSKINEFLKGYIVYSITMSEKVYGDYDFTKENVIKSVIIDIPEELFENSDDSKILAPSLPFVLAKNYYSINQLITAYKKKMKRNHERQDGTADAGKGYV